MKVVTYNLHFGGHKGAGNPWQRMIQDLAPDIICAQESFHPSHYFSTDELSQFKGCVWSGVKDRKWGSAILSLGYELQPIDLPEFEGWVVGASVPGLIVNGSVKPAMIFSIHAPSPGPYEPAVGRIFDEIGKRWDRTPLIIAGDFNLTTAIRHPKEDLKNTPGEIALLERLRREFGLSNAWQALYSDRKLPQTLRWVKNPVPPYHCDAIFVSNDHLPHLASAAVEGAGIWTEMSDHNPIVVTLE